jgi:hypothetical protein
VKLCYVCWSLFLFLCVVVVLFSASCLVVCYCIFNWCIQCCSVCCCAGDVFVQGKSTTLTNVLIDLVLGYLLNTIIN